MIEQLSSRYSVFLGEFKAAIMRTNFNKVAGVTEDGVRYKTLFLSKHVEITYVTELMGGSSLFDLVIIDHFIPTLNSLKTIGVNILGHLAPLCSIEIAPVDLNLKIKRCVFLFITVEDSDNLDQKLNDAGLSALLQEGCVETI